MSILFFSIQIVIAYLIGSLPFSVLISKVFFHADIRKHGSGNAGATNVTRTFGIGPGIAVLILDLTKGWIAVMLPVFFDFAMPERFSDTITLQLAMGVSAFMGHVFPLYVGFKGGKGMSTLIGIGIAVFPMQLLFTFIIFLVTFIVVRYISLSSILAAISFPVIVFLYPQNFACPIYLFSIFVALIVPVTHWENIDRLRKGEEKKLLFNKKK